MNPTRVLRQNVNAPARSPVVPGRWLAVAFLAGLMALWWASVGRVPAYVLPPPLDVWQAVVGFLGSENRRMHLWMTLAHIGVSICIAFVGGAMLAFLAQYVRWTDASIYQRVTPFLNAFSGIGWTLLAVIWFGVSSVTVIFTIVVVLLPFALVNLREGLLAQDREIAEMGNSFSRSRWRTWRLLVVPGLIPFGAATLRIMFGVSWKVTLTAELFGGGQGLGQVINLARQEYDTATLFAVILFIIVAVTLADRCLFAPLERLTSRHFAAAR